MSIENSFNYKEKILILKNDAVGDLCQSLPAIHNIINSKNRDIEIYLSERSKNFNFLIKGKNIKFKVFSYDLKFIEKLRIIKKLFFEKIDKVYILTPKNFYFFLPFLFRRIKFYGICLNGPNNYYRPNFFFRKYLYKYIINDRSKIYKRDSTEYLQKKLTSNNNSDNNFIPIDHIKVSEFLKTNIPNNFVYLHLKNDTIKKLGWDINDLKYLFENLLKYYQNVVFTKDIEKNKNFIDFSKLFNVINFSNKEIIKKENKIYLFDNIKGEDLYNTIKLSSKIIAFHGMMTNLGSLMKKSITDLWFCEINNWHDYRNYRNAFYEFKPKYNGYNFIIPSKDIKKTFRKLIFSIK